MSTFLSRGLVGVDLVDFCVSVAGVLEFIREAYALLRLIHALTSFGFFSRGFVVLFDGLGEVAA